MRKLSIFILSLLALFAFSACSDIDDASVVDDLNSMPVDGDVQNLQVFALTAEDFSFFMNGEKSPDLKVKLGDTVRVELSITAGFHDFVIDEFNASTARVNEGESVFVEFLADKAGTFEYYCSVGEHRAAGMFGKLIVE